MSTNIRGDKTRQQILDTAWNLIAEKGADISLGEIAKASGVTRQALHLHFGKRGGLLTAMVRRADERATIIEKFAADIQIKEVEKRLTTFLNTWFDFISDIFPVASDLIRLRTKDPEAAAAWEDRMQHLRAISLELIQSIEKDSSLSAEWQPKPAAEFLWTLMSIQTWGLLTDDCKWSKPQARAVLIQQAHKVILKKS